MKFNALFLLLIVLLINCPKKYAPKVEKIEVLYLSSLYEDIYREEPYLTGLKNIPGIKIGYLETEPPSMARLLGRLGFYQLLDEFPLDFIICDTTIHNAHYMSIPKSMGYGITNYKGIRFAILSKDKDSLTIEDEVIMTLVRQRSDVLWVIDKNLISLPPQKIDFFIEARALTDTSMSALTVTHDTSLHNKLGNFKHMLDKVLNKKIDLESKRLDEYVLSKVALHDDVNIILYPETLFLDREVNDSLSIDELLRRVRCETIFNESSRMTRAEIEQLSKERRYTVWGKLMKNNRVSLPDTQGTVLFDILYPPEILQHE